MKKAIAACAFTVAVCLCIGMSACGSRTGGSEPKDAADAPAAEPARAAEPTAEPEPEPAADAITFGSTFEFDDLSITLGDGFFQTTIDNQFSDLDGETVIGVPATIANIGDEKKSLNMFAVSTYGSAGVEQDLIYTYFDDDLRMLGDMRPGASQEGALYFLYDGDGDYYIDFGFYSTDVEVVLPISLE